MEKRVSTPLTEETIRDLRAGDKVLLTGYLYTARDAAHKRMVEALRRGEELPINVKGQVIYYVGPTPPKPGQVIGSAGPTTSIRMDKYVEDLLVLGLKGMIGKGYRSPQVKELLKKYGAVYFAAVGGVAVLLSKCIKSSEVVAYEDLGTEAIRRLYVEDFPVIVANDVYGGDVFEEGRRRFARVD
ncbi:MAG: Fe-S-containing hydro-lyase [Aquificaceae bacterium]|nr:Fe-S-containing hydro-lyase [Aquificaceae bacterium]MDW8097578.1 Fe-S-containing hydro-lyase [Aquificaceae bacterium]